MKNSIIILTLLIFFLGCSRKNPQRDYFTVNNILSGNQIHLLNGYTVNLIGVKSSTKSEDYLKSNLKQKRVKFKFDSKSPFKRISSGTKDKTFYAYVILEKGPCINSYLLQNRLAEIDFHPYLFDSLEMYETYNIKKREDKKNNDYYDEDNIIYNEDENQNGYFNNENIIYEDKQREEKKEQEEEEEEKEKERKNDNNNKGNNTYNEGKEEKEDEENKIIYENNDDENFNEGEFMSKGNKGELDKLIKACDYLNSITRDFAVKIAGRTSGEYNIQQVINI